MTKGVIPIDPLGHGLDEDAVPRCLAGERHRARKRGGIARSHRAATLPADAPDHLLTSVADVLSLLEETANAVRRGELETRLANCIGYLGSIALNGLAQIPAPENRVSVEFCVHAPVPCPACKTTTGLECGQCQGLGYVTAPLEPSECLHRRQADP